MTLNWYSSCTVRPFELGNDMGQNKYKFCFSQFSTPWGCPPRGSKWKYLRWLKTVQKCVSVQLWTKKFFSYKFLGGPRGPLYSKFFRRKNQRPRKDTNSILGENRLPLHYLQKSIFAGQKNWLGCGRHPPPALPAPCPWQYTNLAPCLKKIGWLTKI